ncbi:MAG: cysteine hydrolase family protein [Sedimentibacter sp.]
MKKTALILIDIQNIYFTEGTYLLNKPEIAVGNARKVLEHFRENNLPIIHIQHSFENVGDIEKKQYLNCIHKEVAPKDGEVVIGKKYPNSFLNTELEMELKKSQVEELVILGMMSHMCVDTTVRMCQNYGYKVCVIEDACTTKKLNFQNEEISAEIVHKVFMASLDNMFAKVMGVDEFLLQAEKSK